MKGADYKAVRISPTDKRWLRRTTQQWAHAARGMNWTYKKANAGIPMYLWIDQPQQEVGLQRKKPNRTTKLVIATGTLGTLWETFMDYARML